MMCSGEFDGFILSSYSIHASFSPRVAPRSPSEPPVGYPARSPRRLDSHSYRFSCKAGLSGSKGHCFSPEFHPLIHDRVALELELSQRATRKQTNSLRSHRFRLCLNKVINPNNNKQSQDPTFHRVTQHKDDGSHDKDGNTLLTTTIGPPSPRYNEHT
jgi:hypothetical protein